MLEFDPKCFCWKNKNKIKDSYIFVVHLLFVPEISLMAEALKQGFPLYCA